MTGKRRMLVTAFGIFLIFMAVCTLVAKGIYTSGLSRVTAGSPEQKYLNHRIMTVGTVKQGREFGIYVEPDLRVIDILVKNGDTFEAGTMLFKVDAEDLEKKIESMELELNKLLAGQKESASSESLEQKKEKLSLTRAQEDYDLAVRDGELAISRARLEYTNAEEALEEYKKEQSAAAPSVSGGDSEGNRGEKQRQLEKAVRESAQAVEDAILAKDKLLMEANRNIEDARLAAENVYSSSKAAVSLEVAYQKKSIDEMEKLLLENGCVYSEESGRVLSQNLSVGERTLDTACLLYARNSGEGILEIMLTKEQARHVSVDDPVNLQYISNGRRADKDAVINYLSSDGLCQVKLGSMDVKVGQPVTFSHTKQSESYSTCIPITALQQDERGRDFVYLIEEQDGILGKEWYVRTIGVTILDQNETYAAIEGIGITGESRVVYTHTKEIKEGDVVRLVEPLKIK